MEVLIASNVMIRFFLIVAYIMRLKTDNKPTILSARTEIKQRTKTMINNFSDKFLLLDTKEMTKSRAVNDNKSLCRSQAVLKTQI